MANNDETGQKVTGPQQNINLFLAGMSDTEAAESLGVARQTVNKWKNQNLRDLQQQKLSQENHRQCQVWLIGQFKCYVRTLESENERIRKSTTIHILKATGFYAADSRGQQLGKQ